MKKIEMVFKSTPLKVLLAIAICCIWSIAENSINYYTDMKVTQAVSQKETEFLQYKVSTEYALIEWANEHNFKLDGSII